MPEYSLEEVAKHTSEDSCWIIIKGKVLDVTKWLKQHPGGKSILLKVAGQDATFEFTAQGHSGGAWKHMAKYEIGTLVESGFLQSASRSPLACTPTACMGFVAATRVPTARSHSALASSKAGRGGRGAARGKGRGGKSNHRKTRDEDSAEDEVEITTYVSCPQCMADSFITPEALGEGRRLRCANCGKSFNATAEQLRDINKVYSSEAKDNAAGSKSSSFTEDSFFEMFGAKKTLLPPE